MSLKHITSKKYSRHVWLSQTMVPSQGGPIISLALGLQKVIIWHCMSAFSLLMLLTLINEAFLPATMELWQFGVGEDGYIYQTWSTIIKTDLNTKIYVVNSFTWHVCYLITEIVKLKQIFVHVDHYIVISFKDRCLSFCYFSFVNCIASPYSINSL